MKEQKATNDITHYKGVMDANLMQTLYFTTLCSKDDEICMTLV